MVDDPFADNATATPPADTKPKGQFKGKPATPVDDPFGDPAATGNYPSLMNLKGRYLVIQPTKLETGLPSTLPGSTGKTFDRITANVLICNGDDITHRWDRRGEPEAELDPVIRKGDVLEDFYISGAKIVRELTPAFKAGTVVIGKLVQLKPQGGNNPPWSLEPIEKGHPARAAAGKMWLDWQASQAEAAVEDPFSS